MHELGLCEAILGAVEARAGDRPVARIRVRVGRLHHVHPDAFEQSFAIAALGSVAHEADADLVLLPVKGNCTACGVQFESDDRVVACSACGSFDLDITGGDELVLESIEYRA